ncbi:MAG: type II toxin-antitoxin system VapC family toxin [Geminicoccales bacterium]
MQQLVLDTCALVALAEGETMRASAIAAIEAAQDAQVLFVPSFVALEVAQKMAVGKLVLGKAGARTWFAHAVRSFGLTEIALSANMALAAYELPEPFHRDPADRVIVAIARLLNAPVVTVDRRILAYGQQGHVQMLAY